MSAPNLDLILNGLDKVRKSGKGWEACCPSHDDHKPSLSLSISERDGKVLVHCWAGCSQKDVISALRNMGLWGSESRGAYPRPAPRPRDTGPDADDSRRMRQGAALYKAAKAVMDFPDLMDYLREGGLDPALVAAAGGRANRIARADLKDKAPPGWIKGEMANALIFPVYHPDDILKSGEKRLMGSMRVWPWGRPGGPRSVKAALGKTHAPDKRGAGGFLIGNLTRGARLDIVEGQETGVADHIITCGGPTLVLFTAGGMAGIGAGTILDIAAAEARVRIAGDTDPSGAGETAAEKCAERILLAAPQVPLTIALPPGEKADWRDMLVEHGREVADRLLTERERPPSPPVPPKPGKRKRHIDASDLSVQRFLAEPDLSGGPLGPEPPPFTGNVIPHMPWRRRPDAPERSVLPPLPDMQAELRAALPSAIEAAIAGKPVLIMTPPGGGKSRMTLEALLTARVPIPTKEDEPAGDRPANFLWATATKDLAHEAFQLAGASPTDMEWDGRGVEGLCNRPVATQCLMDRGRSPHQNACMKCEFGVKPKGEDEDTRCQFQKNLSEAPFRRGIFGQHGIVGKESTLLKWAADPRNDFQDRDVLVIDEGVPTFAQGTVRIDDITGARVAALGIEDHISRLQAQNRKHRGLSSGNEGDDDRFSEEDFQRARDWAAAITPHLDALGGHLVQSAAHGEGLRALDAQAWGEFAKLATRIPAAAHVADATALEKVQDIFGDKRVVPLAWIAALGRALQAGTAWVRVGKDGTVTLVYTNPADLWTRYLKRGGLLLDASCTHIDEIIAAGGVVIDLRCAQPNLRVIQYGPLLHGKGDSDASAEGRTRLQQEAEALRAAMGNDPDVVVITHKALARTMKDERVRHWGTHKGHNDWKHKRRLILWGLPLLNANDQIIGYKTYRAAMAARGIDLPDWNGERVREWVEAGEWDLFPAAQLPAVKEARDWLLRLVGEDVFQAIGRLRAVWATKPVQVEIYGLLPIVGFGMHVDEMRLESQGRLARKTRARAVIAQGIVDLGEARTRAKLVEYFKRHTDTGVGISKDQCDALVAEIKVQALESGVTLDASARQSCAINTHLLAAGHEPRAIAQAAREIGGLPDVVAVADLLDQCRRVPGAQRAGP